jgi:UDP-N-acetylmuramoyl-tripeptide--D-alanyl-D-alanine ligase
VIPLTLGEIAAAVDGRLAGGAAADVVVTGPVVADSRQSAPGSLFACLVGERADGHDHAEAAVAAGAVAVLAARDVAVPAVVVDDPQTALGRLARFVLGRVDLAVVGVTGSSGKTSTKDLLAQVFEAAGPTVAPEASLNTEVGLPLTVLRVDDATRTLVCEYSARGLGHISYLCDIAPPDVSIVLNVGAAHLGEFGSREAVAQAKGELVEALSMGGVAVLNADDPLVSAMAERTRARVVTFGTAAGADIRIVDLAVDEAARASFRLVTDAGERRLQLQVHGVHQASNAAAVVAAGLARGLDLDVIVDVLGRAVIRSAHRMDVRNRADGLVVIDDAYNANPESVRAALDALAKLGAGRRRWAVLGEMRELGAESAQLHEAVGRHAAETGVEELLAVGAAPVAAGARSVAGWSGQARELTDAASASALLAAEVQPDDVVLVKASNTLRFWEIADALTERTSTGVRS